MLIQDVEPGSLIHVLRINVVGTLIGERLIGPGDKQYCLGLKNQIGNVGWVLEHKLKERSQYLTEWYPGTYDDCNFGWWLYRNDECNMIIPATLPIVDPTLTCFECKTSAPHAEPNLPNKKYICSICKTIKEICEHL
jgi:hypothetical protein